jgi:trans-2,3-dihydro-3-hydroxyanthranilate isomerase
MEFYIVDVFAEEPYGGNPLAVIRGNPTTELMQKIALEMNYSETTFITSDEIHSGGYNVRIFTINTELPFAGHPTLGTAFILREELNAPEPVVLNLRVGQIPVTFRPDGTLWMKQKAPVFGCTYEASEVADVLGLSIDDIDTRFPVQEGSTGLPFIITPLRTKEAVERANVVHMSRFIEMVAAGQNFLKADAMLVFAPETVHEENDLHARVFVHLHGIPEDPATGSANGVLAAWLAKYRYFGGPKVTARVEQGYEMGRPSLLLLDSHDTGDTIEVNVGGRVRWVARGQLV